MVSSLHRPVIGLSSYRVDAQWGVWSGEAVLLPITYTGSIEAAGGIPLLLPPLSPQIESAELVAAAAAVLQRVDGLIISGGSDVDPRSYHASADPRTDEPNLPRDHWEFALLDAADRIGLPVLGICRGVQVMAVHAGGSLHQHVPDVVGHSAHSPGGPDYGEIDVAVTPDSRLGALIDSRLTVSCHHHQAVDKHPGLTIVAESSDGVIEALESPGERFNLGVQWHPEERDDTGLFGGFVRACREAAPLAPHPSIGAAGVSGGGRSRHAGR